MAEELKFRGSNPGAVQHGNFINYYQFHPPENRISLLPQDKWVQEPNEDEFIVLDIGCNAGDLTIALESYFKNIINLNIAILGIDIDPILIERANEHNTSTNIIFQCLDFMDENRRNEILKHYLAQFNRHKFDAVFCFSTTMWIHLNNGDDGLETFLKELCSITDILVIEPQPWKCYKTALKRVKGHNDMFPEFAKLKIRNEIEEKVGEIINATGMLNIKKSGRTQWGRKVLIFKRK